MPTTWHLRVYVTIRNDRRTVAFAVLPKEQVAKLAAMGFALVFHLTSEKANERYFKSRSDGLTASILEQMISARSCDLNAGPRI
jgi:hypothetical protein